MGKVANNSASNADKAFDAEKGSDGSPQTIIFSFDRRTRKHVFTDTNSTTLVCHISQKIWDEEWKRLSKASRQGKPEAFDYIDYDHKTVLVVKVLLKEEEGGEAYSVNAELKLRRLAGTNRIFDDLNEMTKGSS